MEYLIHYTVRCGTRAKELGEPPPAPLKRRALHGFP
jgi:hypothetical protein